MGTRKQSVSILTRFSGRRIRMLRDVLFDLRHRSLLRGTVPSRHRQSVQIANTDVTALERIFRGRIRGSDVLVDVGCGKGRVIHWWLSQGIRQPIIGLEVDEEIAERTRQRLRRYPNVTIITGDAVANLPRDATLFYLYHPFSEPVVRAFSKRMKDLYGARRPVTVLYYNPVHADVFRSDPAWEVQNLTIGGDSFHRLCVLELR
jgi:methyltransferase family protein